MGISEKAEPWVPRSYMYEFISMEGKRQIGKWKKKNGVNGIPGGLSGWTSGLHIFVLIKFPSMLSSYEWSSKNCIWGRWLYHVFKM